MNLQEDMKNVSFMKQGATLSKKWAELLKESRYDRRKLEGADKYVTAALLENQQMLCETSSASDVAGLQTIFLSLVRRVYPNLIANDLVGVQPLSTPGGIIFYLKTFLTTDKSYLSSSTKANEIGVWDDTTGRFRYDTSYSAQYATTQVGIAAVATGAVTVSGTGTPTTSAATSGTGTICVLRVYNAQGTELGGCRLLSSAGTFSYVTSSNWGDVLNTGNTVVAAGTGTTLTFTGDIAMDGTGDDVVQVVAEYVTTSPRYGGEGDSTYGNGYSGNWPIPEVEFRFESQTIGVYPRKLKTAWSMEMEQDMKNYHGEDAEDLLVTQLSMQIMLDIDREIIGKLRSAASFIYTHDFTSPIGSGITGAGLHLRDYNEAMATATNFASNYVYQRCLRGAANWAVTNPTIASRLDALNIFRSSGDVNERAVGLESVGTLGRKLKVFTDPIYPANEILLGYKGATPVDSGFIYAPYIPLAATATLVDPNDLTSKKALMVRYGTLLVNQGEKFYGRVVVKNMPEFTNVDIVNVPSVSQMPTNTLTTPVGGYVPRALGGTQWTVPA